MIYDTLNNYNKLNRISFAMPGHKGGRGIDFDPRDFDITELSYGVDLHHPNASVNESLEYLRSFYGTDLSLYITGGSTSGIFIMLSVALQPGDTVAIGRGCHLSVINACIFLGLNAVIIPQETDKNLNVLRPVDKGKIDELFLRYKNIKAVLLTSPTYYGECADIKSIADTVHKYNIPLLVDEAHGAHFKSCSLLPDSAIDLGADICVQSAHKTLDALTPAAFLHVKSRLIKTDTVKKITAMRETSSPPYYLVASAEAAVKKLECDPYANTVSICKKFRRMLKKQTNIIMPEGNLFDSARLVFCFANYNITGFEAERLLRERYNIDCEAADSLNVICIATPSNTEAEIKLLFDAVRTIADGAAAKTPEIISVMHGFAEAAPAKAFYAEHDDTELYGSAGRVAASNVFVYPPGIPMICVGERITEEALKEVWEAEKNGAEIIGKETFCVVK